MFRLMFSVSMGPERSMNLPGLIQDVSAIAHGGLRFSTRGRRSIRPATFGARMKPRHVRASGVASVSLPLRKCGCSVRSAFFFSTHGGWFATYASISVAIAPSPSSTVSGINTDLHSLIGVAVS